MLSSVDNLINTIKSTKNENIAFMCLYPLLQKTMDRLYYTRIDLYKNISLIYNNKSIVLKTENKWIENISSNDIKEVKSFLIKFIKYTNLNNEVTRFISDNDNNVKISTIDNKFSIVLNDHITLENIESEEI